MLEPDRACTNDPLTVRTRQKYAAQSCQMCWINMRDRLWSCVAGNVKNVSKYRAKFFGDRQKQFQSLLIAVITIIKCKCSIFGVVRASQPNLFAIGFQIRA